MQNAMIDIAPTEVQLAADRNAIRMEYEATDADARVLLLLNELEHADKALDKLNQRLSELESRLTRRPTATPAKPTTTGP
jgi:hypothetical protein